MIICMLKCTKKEWDDMKSKYFKYVFIAFAIAIMIFAVVKIKSDEQKKEEIPYETTQE